MKFLVRIAVGVLCFFPISGNAKGIEEALKYHQNSGFQWDAAMEILRKISWQGDERVLDIGCGDGKITALIASHCTHSAVIGLDISTSLIQFASNKFTKAEFPHLFFTEGRAEELPFNEQFDVVVSFTAFHWVLDQEKALRGIFNALVPGGRCYISTIGKSPMNFATLSESLIFSDKWASDFLHYKAERIYFTEEEYRTLLERVGFENVEVSRLESVTWYADRQALFNFLKPVITFIRHLSPEKQELFLNELVDKFISLGEVREDGAISMRLFSLQAAAKKNLP